MIPAGWWIGAGGIAGLIAGSFIATLVIRWPKGETLGGRSRCDGCERTLGARDLIPVVSYLATKGRCRTCGGTIDPGHFAVELCAAVIGLVAFAAAPGPAGIAGALFGWQLLTLAALDVEHFWLPDRLTALLAASGVVAGYCGIGAALSDRLIGGLAGLGSLWLIAWSYRAVRGRQGMGAGDPKLFGAVGLWLGWQSLPFVLLGASGVGLIAALIMRARGGTVAAHTRLPLGALIAVAAFPAWVLAL